MESDEDNVLLYIIEVPPLRARVYRRADKRFKYVRISYYIFEAQIDTNVELQRVSAHSLILIQLNKLVQKIFSRTAQSLFEEIGLTDLNSSENIVERERFQRGEDYDGENNQWNESQYEKDPLISLILLCDDSKMRDPIRTAYFPLRLYPLAIVSLLNHLSLFLFSKNEVDLSKGLKFMIQVCETSNNGAAPITPPIQGLSKNPEVVGAKKTVEPNIQQVMTGNNIKSKDFGKRNKSHFSVQRDKSVKPYKLGRTKGRSKEHTLGEVGFSLNKELNQINAHQESVCISTSQAPVQISYKRKAINNPHLAHPHKKKREEGSEHVWEEHAYAQFRINEVKKGKEKDVWKEHAYAQFRINEVEKEEEKGEEKQNMRKEVNEEKKGEKQKRNKKVCKKVLNNFDYSFHWANKEKGLFPLPSYDSDKELYKTCLLTPIVLGLFLADELKKAKTWGELWNKPQNVYWKGLLPIKRKSPKKSILFLKFLIKEVIKKYDIDVSLLRKGNLCDLEPFFSKFKLNLFFYHRAGAEQCFFIFPDKYVPEWASLHILILPSKTCEDVRESNDDKLTTIVKTENVWHASAIIVNPSAYLEKSEGKPCVWCHKPYKTQSYSTHKCSLPEGRKRCYACRRVIGKNTDFASLYEIKERCKEEKNYFWQCPMCKQATKSKNCRLWHSRLCKKRKLQYCSICSVRYSERGGNVHKCGKNYCLTCKVHYDKENEEESTHSCFITSAQPSKHVDMIAVWDTETVCDKDTKNHIVNAVGLAFEDEKRGQWSEIYFYSNEMNHCEDRVLRKNTFQHNYYGEEKYVAKRNEVKCAKKLRAFKKAKMKTRHDDSTEDQTALEKFLDFILKPKFAHYTFIAHYGQAFDFILLMKRLMLRSIKCEPIFDGNKAMLIKLPELSIRFVDSHRYVSCSLDKFPKRFPAIKNLLPEQYNEKGSFPYKFNQPENYFYEGAIPSLEMFVDEYSSEQKRQSAKSFIQSYEGTYSFQKELHFYLKADVKVLMSGLSCLLKEFYTFQNELQENNEEEKKIFFHCFNNPFLTMPQYLHTLWRTFGLEHKLHLLANQTLARKTSISEIEWLAYEQHLSPNTHIRTSLNHVDGQKKMGVYALDGYCEETNTAYEFLGCVVHCHWMVNRDCPLTRGLRPTDCNPFGESPWKVHNRFDNKQTFLEKNCKMTVKTMWECEWICLKKTGSNIEEMLKEWRILHSRPQSRLVIRQALRGGRVETFSLLFDKRDFPQRRLIYIDQNSLYPTVAIKNFFPVGKGKIYLGKQLEQFEITSDGMKHKISGLLQLGIVQATVEAPESIFLPILPIMNQNKLMFGLCKKCIEKKQEKFCDHQGEERYLTDVWTIPEIVFAIKQGYKIIKLHEALLYEEQAPIFQKFYIGLAKMKLESEMPPPSVDMNDPVSLKKYCEKLNSQMPWLNLEWKKIIPNSGRREFSKQCQNCALGKLSQSAGKRRVSYVRHWKELAEIRNNPRYKIICIHPIDDSLAEVVYEEKHHLLGLQKNTQVVVYSHVTAYARITMMEDMLKLMKKGFKLFYTDTDSIIVDMPKEEYQSFIKENDIGSPSYGYYKEETKGEILNFYSLGCKNYNFRTDANEIVTKVRGFTLNNVKAKETLNSETMYKMIVEFLEGRLMQQNSTQHNMKVHRRHYTVMSAYLDKKYSNQTFDKRFVLDKCILTNPTVKSLPYGCKHDKFVDTQ